jgi:monovalent cation:H+ antiporter-2, CPA2 family
VHDIDLILTLTGGLTAALVLGAVAHALKLSPIVGYLLAGVVVGPHSPGFTADHAIAGQLAEVGVILLLFGVGLHFHVHELWAVRRVALPGALVATAVAIAAGVAVAHLAGHGWPAAIVFGGAVSVASTVVLVRVLADNHLLHTPAGHVAVGWVVVEDVLTVAALVVLPAVLGGGADGPREILVAVGTAAVKIVGLAAMVVLAGGRVIPRLLERVAATRSRELFTLAVLVVALGIAVGAARLFGVSMALGAFLAGMVVGRSDFSLRAASEALPMRDAFAVLFFVSVGMLFDPSAVLATPLLQAATLGIVLLVKPATALVIVLLRGQPAGTAVTVAASLAHIGEFSFILAALGRQFGSLPDDLSNALVAASIASITLNPLLFRCGRPLARLLERLPGRRMATPPAAGVDTAGDAGQQPPTHRAIVVGYGPVGRTVTALLLDNGIEPTVIELNLDTVRHLRAFDVRAVYGDATRPEILLEAGIARAGTLVVATGSGDADPEIVRHAKEINPAVHVLARSAYLRDLPRLRQAGAADVFAAEGEVALAFTVSILQRLGATPDQIDRERARVEATFRAG